VVHSTLVTPDLVVAIGALHVDSVILVTCYDNTNFENSQKSVFCSNSGGRYEHEGLIAGREHARDLLSDLRTLQNRRHFGSTMLCTKGPKHRFLQTI
jgi:hypothetical protein